MKYSLQKVFFNPFFLKFMTIKFILGKIPILHTIFLMNEKKGYSFTPGNLCYLR
jgi:hypothetical protein